MELPSTFKVKDSTQFSYVTSKAALKTISNQLAIKYTDSSINHDWVEVKGAGLDMKSVQKQVVNGTMPNITGMKLQDALWICEKNGLQVKTLGKGKVILQSIAEGQAIVKGQQIQIQLN